MEFSFGVDHVGGDRILVGEFFEDVGGLVDVVVFGERGVLWTHFNLYYE